jgi:hypothetical protein
VNRGEIASPCIGKTCDESATRRVLEQGKRDAYLRADPA